MEDSSIITKFELSKREKELKAKFFNANLPSSSSQSMISNENMSVLGGKKEPSFEKNVGKINKFTNTLPEFKQEEMRKFYNENKKIFKSAQHFPQSFQHQNNSVSPQQITMLFKQNKMIERNMDLMKETNRNIQDLLVYTMKKDMKNNENKGENIAANGENSSALRKIIEPLVSNINDLEKKVNLLNQASQPPQNQNIDDLVIKSQEKFLSNPQNVPRIPPKKSKEKEKILKMIGDLQGTMGQITSQISQMSSKFNQQLSSVMEKTQKERLEGMIAGEREGENGRNVVKLPLSKSKTRSKSPANSTKKPQQIPVENSENLPQTSSILKTKLEPINYDEFKNDLIDIEWEKNNIMNEYKKSRPEFEKLTKPKEKVKFSYEVEYPEEEKVKERSSKEHEEYLRRLAKPKVINASKQKHAQKQVPNSAQNKSKSPNPNKPPKRPINNDKNSFANYLEPNDINYDLEKNKQNFSGNYAEKMQQLKEISIYDKMEKYRKNMRKLGQNIEVYDNNVNNNDNSKGNDDRGMDGRSKVANLNPFSLGDYQSYQSGIRSDKSAVTLQNFGRRERETEGINPPHPPQNIPPHIPFSTQTFPQSKGEPINIFGDAQNPPRFSPILASNDIKKMVKDTVDNYIRSAFEGLKPENAPKLEAAEKEKSGFKPVVQNVIEKEFVSKLTMEVIQSPVINIPKSENKLSKEFLDQLISKISDKFSGIEKALIEISEKKTVEKIPIFDLGNKEEKVEKKEKINSPNVERITEMVMRKLRNDLEIFEKEEESKEEKEESKRESVNRSDHIFDESQRLKIEELDDMIKMPHNINLKDYEVSQTSGYVSDENKEKPELNLGGVGSVKINRVNVNKSVVDRGGTDGEVEDNSLSQGQIESSKGALNASINKGFSSDIEDNNVISSDQKQENFVNQINMENNAYNSYVNFMKENRENAKKEDPRDINVGKSDDFFDESKDE